MNLLSVLQSVWEQDVLVPVLIDTVTVFTLIILFLFFGLFAYRLYSIRREQAQKKRKAEVEGIIFSYLDEEKTISDVEDYLKANLNYKTAFLEVCVELLKSLGGDIEIKIKKIIEVSFLQQHYIRLLDRGDTAQKVKALFYFKQCQNPKPVAIERMYELINDPNTDLATAASLALCDSKPPAVQFMALGRLCERSEITSLTLLEHVLMVSDTDQADFEERGDKILQMIRSPLVSDNNRLALIRGMGFVGFITQAPALYNLLKGHLEKDSEPNVKLVCALIETIGMLEFSPSLPLLEKLTQSSNHEVCISCAKAIGFLNGDEAVKVLDRLIRHPGREVRHEAMKQLIRIGADAIPPLAGQDEDQMPEIEVRTLQEIKERRQYHHA